MRTCIRKCVKTDLETYVKMCRIMFEDVCVACVITSVRDVCVGASVKNKNRRCADTCVEATHLT